MSSFVETKALEQLTKSPVEFVEYPFCILIIVKLLCEILLCHVVASQFQRPGANKTEQNVM